MNALGIESTKKLILNETNIILEGGMFSLSSVLITALILTVFVIVIGVLIFSIRSRKKQPYITEKIDEPTDLTELPVKKEIIVEKEPEIPMRVIELEELKGIGAKSAEKLKSANIMTVYGLAQASAEDLAQKTGISEKRLSKWIEQAKMHESGES